MLKKIIAALAALLAATAFAAVDANKASQAELESIKGIGPAISTKIVDERKKGNYKDWNDLVTRVNGIGDKNAATFSTGGLTVDGKTYAGAPAAKMAPAASKPSTTDKVTGSVKSGADSVASGAKSAGHAVAESGREQKAAFKENLAETKAKSAEKKAAKAEAKAEKAAAASAPKK